MKHFSLSAILLLVFLPVDSQTFIRSELPTEITRPWEILYGPDNFLWVTEKEGKVSRINPLDGSKTVVYTAPDYFGGSPLEDSELCPNLPIGVGTLGLALHPDFSNDATAFIYFVYSYNSGTEETPATKFRIKRLKWDAESNTVTNDTNIVNLITTGYDHLGGRLLAIKQNGIPYLFLSVGDNGRSEQNAPDCYSPQSENPNNFTQDISTQNGKIHRFHMNGDIPLDNPIPNNSFYTRGHRNPQGLMYNPNLDVIYNIEHGDRTDDEINILYKGMNYGWKDVRGYHDDNSFLGEIEYVSNYVPEPLIANDALIEPFFAWCTTPDVSSVWTDWCTVAPSGGAYYGSNAIPEWNNSLLVVTLKDGLTTDREVFQFKLHDDGTLVSPTTENPNPKKFFGEDQGINGRLRDIAVSGDGQTIYLVNNGGTDTDKIIVYSYDTTNVGLIESVGNPNIQLYPNPVHDRLTIEGVDNLINLREIKISTILGKTTIVELSDDSVDVSTFTAGIYYIHFFYGNKVHTLKFVKS